MISESIPAPQTGRQTLETLDTSPMRVTVARGDIGLIDTYAEEWRALCAEGPCIAPFYSPGWARAHVEAFAPDAELNFLVVRNGERLRGLLPLVARRWKGIPWGRRWLQSLSNVHSPRFDVIHGCDDRPAVERAIADFLQTWRGWDVIQCRMLPGDGVLSQVTATMEQAGTPLECYARDEVPYIDLEAYAPDVPTVISSLTKKARNNLRRYIRRIEEHGEVRTYVYSSENSRAEIREQLESLYHLESSGWKGEGGTAIVSNPELRAFYDGLAEHAHASSQLRLFRVEANGEPVAIEIAVTADDELYLLKFGINEKRRDWGPGHLLTLYQVAAATASGYTLMDLSGTMESHKEMWTALTRPLHSCILFRPTLHGRVLHRLMFGVATRLRARYQSVPMPQKVRSLMDN